MSFRLENPIHAPQISIFFEDFPNFSFWGFTPEILLHIIYTPKRHFLARNDAFWALIGPDPTHSATCELGKENKKKKEKRIGKLAIRSDHPRRRIEVKVCMSGGLQYVVLYIKF